MQRWFYTDEAEACDAMPAPSPSISLSVSSSSAGFGERDWCFCVLVNIDILPNEFLSVTGNCEVLGNWQISKSITMKKKEDCNVWSINVKIPRGHPTEYRYFVGALDPTTEKIIVRRWETHLKPRKINETDDEPLQCSDIFGCLLGFEKVERGWLTSETIVQLRFFNAPFTFKQRMKRRLVYLKVTPMNLKIPSGCDNMVGSSTFHEDSLSNDHDTRENGQDMSTAFAFNEVASLSPEESIIKMQPQFGTACGPDDLVVFHLTLGDFENIAYLIDLYTYKSKAALDDPPYHLGYHYVLPNLLKRSEGLLEVPITCASKHRPLGMMKFGYLIIRPLPTCQETLDMSVSYSRYWNDKWTGLDVGHRGSGTSFKANNDSSIRENTITSLNYAVEHGADMVEFDVQLSKDLVPVVYHDFMIYVSLKTKKDMQVNDFLSLPMRDLTLDQLRHLKVYHTAEGKSRETRSFKNDDLQEHQPFPTLEEVMEAINPHVGFNIEIKWSQKLNDGTMEEEFEHVVDRNLYLDCILDVVLRKAGNRRIVLSCFDPDICTMLRFKQNRYPVMFLILGVTTKYKTYMDPRGYTIQASACHALSMELLGIVAHTEDLLRDPSQVNYTKGHGLVIFCWGEDNNSKDTIKFLKKLGLHAIIYDKMDMLTSKEVKKSVFLLQSKDSQKELLKLQCLEMGKVWHSGDPTSQD